MVLDSLELTPKDRTCSGLRLRADELARGIDILKHCAGEDCYNARKRNHPVKAAMISPDGMPTFSERAV
ncbi:hypothetical protein YA62_016190 [Agrobacterium sp. LC34]|nr:hypothetical protein YA62_016190 [Agrobacterium sp. LC34]